MVSSTGAHLSVPPAPVGGALRILLVAPQPFFEVRGTPLNVLQMVRVLTGAGHEVHLATYPIGKAIAIPGRFRHFRSPGLPGVRRVAIGFSWRKVVLDALLALTVWRRLLTERYDVVHAVEESIFFTLPAARLRRRPVIYDLDSVISDQLRYSGRVTNRTLLNLVHELETAALRGSDIALTVSRSLTDAVRERHPGATVVQIEDCPVAESLRAPDPAAVAELRGRFGLPERGVVVYTGNLEPYQGVDLLLEAWHEVAERWPGARLLIVGGEDAHIAAARASLAPSTAETVTFAGPVPPGSIADVMGLADVLVSPRRAGDNTPLKLYSYMHSAVPIVATDLWTHRQVLDETTAVLCPPSREGLAEAITAVLADPAAFAERGRAARARVERDYSPEVFAKKLLAVYERISTGDFSTRASSA